MKIFLFILTLFVYFPLAAQKEKASELIRSGNEFYQQQEWVKAAGEYQKAAEKDPTSFIAKFNQANAIYKQDRKVDAAKLYATVISGTEEKDLRSKAYYNKGVVLTKEKNLEESIEAYKNALRINPADAEARENLQKALLELKKKQPPPPPKKEDQKKKKEQQQQQKQQSKMSPREAEQRLKLLQQKEKEVQQRMQKEKSKMGGGKPKDW
jgi:Ca-activated chloride channel homolog